MFIVDISKEHIAVKEAKRLSIPVFAMVDTNSDPNSIEFPIPSNDDASKSISLVVDKACQAIAEGLEERKLEKEKEGAVKDKDEEMEDEIEDTPKKSAARKEPGDEDIDNEDIAAKEDDLDVDDEDEKPVIKKKKDIKRKPADTDDNEEE